MIGIILEHRKVLLGVFGALAVVGLCGKFVWSPVSRGVRENRAKLEAARQEIQKAKAIAARRSRVEQEIVAMQEPLQAARRGMPMARNGSQLAVTLTALARKFGVELKSFTPGMSEQKAYYIESAFLVSLNGSLKDIERVLSALHGEERILNVRSLSLGPADPAGRMSAEFTLVAYQYKS